MKKRLSLSDIPLSETTNDFGTDSYVNGLVKFIENSEAPITIALQGEWGSGKTSLMNSLYKRLCTEGKKFMGININTWEFSMLSTPEETVVKIIAQLVRELSKNNPKPKHTFEKILKGGANLLLRTGREWAKGLVPGVAGMVIEGAGVPTEFSFDKEKAYEEYTLSDLKHELTEAIEQSLKSNKNQNTGKEGIIIFVDDLDRLNPPLAVQILELLKNIFTLNHCIFVLAIDYDVVVKGLEPKFGKKNESNEREFRSFFDKIIQVPFSLPVNNYTPNKFVLDSLETIGYIGHGERNAPYISQAIEKIVISSVGKNPRSIKRLINTLSLLDCIADESDKKVSKSEVKIMNFAIVALQVCYPKIYNLLTVNPIFSKWDSSLAAKANLHLSDSVDGDTILAELCKKDEYLGKHREDICRLFDIISENAAITQDSEKVIREILDRSSLTNVSDTASHEELNRKALTEQIHRCVGQYIAEHKKPDMKQPNPKNNTGNGGFWIYLPDDSRYEIVFRPTQNDNTISLQILFKIEHKRPSRLAGLPYKDVLSDAEVAAAIKPFDDAVFKYMRLGFIKIGRPTGTPVHNYIDEMLAIEGSLWQSISWETQYNIDHPRTEDFEDPAIVEVIGDLILASYELKSRAAKLK